MNTADGKVLITDYFSEHLAEYPLAAKDLKRIRKVKDDRGRVVRAFSAGAVYSVVVITDDSDTRMMDLILMDAGSYMLDPDILKDSLAPWDFERIGPKPAGWDNAMPTNRFYFAFCPSYEDGDEPFVVVTRKDLWDTEGFVDDSEISDIVTAPYPLERLMESMYEYVEDNSEEDLRASLTAAGFAENRSITKWVQEYCTG